MRLSLHDALVLTQLAAALLVALQSLELLFIRGQLAAPGPWRPEWVREDQSRLPAPLRFIFAMWMGQRAFTVLLVLRLLLASVLVVVALHPEEFGLVFPWVSWLLLASQLTVSARFLGSFGGGSDAMSMVVLVGLAVASLPLTQAPLAGLGYIAAQSTLSYWVAGVVKLREPDWRSGRALRVFLQLRRYGVPEHLLWLREPRLARVLSWSVIAFECAFPAALLRPEAMVVFTSMGLLFHLGNAYVLGLNRFVFAWAATYPALLFVAGFLSR